jgi:hypothetical protein
VPWVPGVRGRRCATTSEEGLQVRTHSPRERAGVSSIPPIAADAPNVVWAIDFQFDSTVDGKAIKIASMIDEHTRCSLLHLVERSITRCTKLLTSALGSRRQIQLMLNNTTLGS